MANGIIPLSVETTDSLPSQIVQIAECAQLAANDLKANGRRASVFDLTTRPLGEFCRGYIARGGWRDGRAGLICAVAAAFAVFCTYASLWSITGAADVSAAAASVTSIPLG